MSDTQPLPTTAPLPNLDDPKSDEITELRREVAELRAHLAAIEALVLKITETMSATSAGQATVKKPPAQSSTMSRKDMQDQKSSYEKSLPSSEEAADIAKNTIAGGDKNRLKKAR